MAGKPAHPPQPSGPPGEHPERGGPPGEHPERGGPPGEHTERGPHATERDGPLTVERLRKDDGRALIVFTRDQRGREQQP